MKTTGNRKNAIKKLFPLHTAHSHWKTPSRKSRISDPTLPKKAAWRPYKGHSSLLEQLRDQMEVKVVRVKSNPSDLKRPEFASGGRWFCTTGPPGETSAQFDTGQDPPQDSNRKAQGVWRVRVTRGHGERAARS